MLALGLAAAASVGLLWVLQASQMEAHGLIFQGRYILPLAAGVVLVAARAIDEAGDDLVARLSGVVSIVLVLTVVGHLVSIWFAARRFAVGVGGPVFFVREGWTPGISLAVPLAVAAVAVPALAWGMSRWPVAETGVRGEPATPVVGAVEPVPVSEPAARDAAEASSTKVS